MNDKLMRLLKFFIICIVILITLIIVRISVVKKSTINHIIEVTQGKYRLNKELSKLKFNRRFSNDDFFLHFNKDMTFQFSNDLPFIYDTIGDWKPVYTGQYYMIQMVFSKNRDIYYNLGYCCYDKNKIMLTSPAAKSIDYQAEELVFERITSD